jgi:hypothetical protein
VHAGRPEIARRGGLRRHSLHGTTKPVSDLTTEWCWGEVWNRPGLDQRTRSIINLASADSAQPAERVEASCAWGDQQWTYAGRGPGSVSSDRHLLRRSSGPTSRTLVPRSGYRLEPATCRKTKLDPDPPSLVPGVQTRQVALRSAERLARKQET